MLSIVLLTLAVSAATAPFTVFASRAQKRMTATADLNRMADPKDALLGCAPLLIQAPIWILMFNHVRRLASDGMFFGQVDLGQTGIAALHAGPHALALLAVLVVVIVGAGIIQARLTPRRTTAAKSPAENVMRFMPVLFGASLLSLPLALGVYYATSSTFRLGLQWAMTRNLAL